MTPSVSSSSAPVAPTASGQLMNQQINQFTIARPDDWHVHLRDDAVLASVAAFPYDVEVVRQAAVARTELISADRIAGHLRVVQSSFARVLTEFVRNRNRDVPNIDLGAEVAGSALAAALVVAVENWGRNGCADDLGELVAASLDLVRSGLAPLA